MKKRIHFLILTIILFVFTTSCIQNQEEPVESPSTVTTTLEYQIPTTTTVPTVSATPTITPTPKKAEGFENCERLPKFENVGYYDRYGYNIQGGTIISRHVTHDDSSWKINKMGVTVEITNPQVIDGLVYFSINGSKITMTEGAILYIELYKDPPSYDTAYILRYSPTTNSFLTYSLTEETADINQNLIHMDPYPIIIVSIYPDSTVSLTNVGGVTRNYQGDYCVEQNNGSAHIAHEELNEEQCVVYTLPNGDEYGYGVNKNGEVSCMQLWMETE